MLDLAWAAASHAGRVRERNEDAVLAEPPLFLVADGMGGHEAGDVAAACVVDSLARLAGAEHLTRPVVLDAVRAANRDLAALGSRTNRTMGTTLCGLVALGCATRPRFVLFNVGDSRAYRWRDGALEQLTRDHSVVQELLDAGAITGPEARVHPGRHVVTRSLGADDYLAIDWWTIVPRPVERFLLSSDGLTGELDDAAIAAVLGREAGAGAAADALADEALRRGGRDNVSVIVVDVAAADGEPAGPGAAADPLDADTRPRSRRALEPDTLPWTGRAPWGDWALFADTDPRADP